MKLSFEQALIEVWRQALVENAETIELGSERFPVRRTPKRGLRQVDFVFEGKEIRGLEQNPQTKSRWAQMARPGKKVDAVPQRGPRISKSAFAASDGPMAVITRGDLLHHSSWRSTVGGSLIPIPTPLMPESAHVN